MVRWLLKKILLHKELGMWQHGEEFTRFQLFRCKWFKIYLHRLKAPTMLPTSHDHPWDFWTFLIWGGYWEQMGCGKTFWRMPLLVLFRPAETVHNICTGNHAAWSLVLSLPIRRKWSFGHCKGAEWESRSTSVLSAARLMKSQQASKSKA
jgi:hypothetical protein